MNVILRVVIPMVLVTLCLQSHAAIETRIAVKRGQETIPPKKLPLACLVIALDGIGLPLREIILESVDSKKDVAISCEKRSDPLRPDFLTATIGGSRTLSMVIVNLKEGRYRIKWIYYGLRGAAREKGSYSFFLPRSPEYEFAIQSGRINYLGSLVISADWVSPDKHFQAFYSVEDTTSRDEKWATDVIPGMALHPSVASPFRVETATVSNAKQ